MDENKKTPEEKMEVYKKMFDDYAEIYDFYMKMENPEAFELRSAPDPNFVQAPEPEPKNKRRGRRKKLARTEKEIIKIEDDTPAPEVKTIRKPPKDRAPYEKVKRKYVKKIPAEAKEEVENLTDSFEKTEIKGRRLKFCFFHRNYG